MFRYCLFDLDGTLTDPREGITKSVQYGLKCIGIDEPDLKKLEIFIGPPLLDSYMGMYGLDEETARKAIAFYRERFAPIGIFENALFPEVPKMLESLKDKGIHLAVASSKPQTFVHQILKHFEIEEYFEVIVGSELDGRRTAKEEVVEEALRLLGVLDMPDGQRFESCAMIGDRKFDIQGAKAFGLTGVGVRFGFAPEGELEAEGADYIADTIEELTDFLLQ